MRPVAEGLAFTKQRTINHGLEMFLSLNSIVKIKNTIMKNMSAPGVQTTFWELHSVLAEAKLNNNVNLVHAWSPFLFCSFY